MHAEHILIVEDEPVVALDLQHTLVELGHRVCGVRSNFTHALSAVSQLEPTLILMDIHLDGAEDGIDACQAIYQRWKLPVIFLTAYADDNTVKRAIASKPFGYVMKPFGVKELAAVIQVARSRHDAEIALEKSEERLSVALEAADLGIWEWEEQLDTVKGDERFHRMWDSALSPFQANLHTMLECIHPDDRANVQQALTKSDVFNCSFRALRSNGDYAWLEMVGKLHVGHARKQTVIGALRDITLRKLTEENLRQASVVFSTTAEGIMILDEAGKVCSVNPALTRLTGYPQEEILGFYPNEILLGRRDNDPTYQDIGAMPEGYWSGEVACKCKDGRLFPALQHICVVRDDAGKAKQYVHAISDISFIREAQRQLAHLAYHDPLTGLGNRYLLDQRLETEIQQTLNAENHFAVIFVDLDEFKAINDTMGHHVGDRVIQEAAMRIVRQIRRHDEAIRLGGDEFVVIVSSLNHPSEGLLVAEKILRSFAEPVVIEDHHFVIGASIGVAKFPGDGNTSHEILGAADSAMYEAKRCGKGKICAYSSNLSDKSGTRLNIEQNLYGAVERNEFELFYQPIIDLADFRLIGFEALLRWNHPDSGLLEPGQFVHIAEEVGLIDDIGNWVLAEALKQLSSWNEVGQGQLFMAVNVSAGQFQNEQFLKKIRDALDAYQLPAHLLEIEITEAMLQDFHQSRKIVNSLREMGVRVAIDDFGSGYSSIALLKHLPVSRIKIDRSFVIALPGAERDLGMVAAILQMAKSLQLDVTAEGIETAEQARMLRELGCQTIQGYYFGHPMGAYDYSNGWISLGMSKNYFLPRPGR
ncbi:two-component system response regulator [Undibacterium sp. Di26W]|uniref:two-component system response regulator n=1 Tax=Undibacterium sp. Di26W TaxID=3413035 RepID=UPI003BF4134B